MKHILKSISVGLLSLFLMLMTFPTAALAAGEGTITVQFSQCNVSMMNTETDVTLYQVATYSEDETFTLTDEFADCGYSADELHEAHASDMLSVAYDIQSYVLENSISGRAYPAQIGENLEIPGLDQGIYLMMISSIEDDTLICSFSPVLCFIPSVDDEGVVFNHISVLPKYTLLDNSLVVTTTTPTGISDATITTPETTTTTITVTGRGTTGSSTSGDTPERLPQTGPMMWLVYLLLGAGLICLITVWGICRKPSGKKIGKITFLILGVGLLSGAAWICGESYFTEQSSITVMTEAVEQIKASQQESQVTENSSETISSDVETDNADIQEENAVIPDEPMTFEVDGNQYIGVLEIPSLSLELPIAADCSLDTLKKSPGRFKSSSSPSGFVIGAHNYASHFGYLYQLTSHNEVVFTDVSGKVYRYQVTEVTEVLPTQVEAVCNSEHDLALFTCNSSGARRIVAYCDAI